MLPWHTPLFIIQSSHHNSTYHTHYTSLFILLLFWILVYVIFQWNYKNANHQKSLSESTSFCKVSKIHNNIHNNIGYLMGNIMFINLLLVLYEIDKSRISSYLLMEASKNGTCNISLNTFKTNWIMFFFQTNTGKLASPSLALFHLPPIVLPHPG